MHIKCTYCQKTFQIDEKLIPDSGRLLQCGKCDHQWFFNKEKLEKIIDQTLKGETPKAGSYRGRINSEPEHDRKTLMEVKNA